MEGAKEVGLFSLGMLLGGMFGALAIALVSINR